jgi:hypothetical protein
MAEICLSLKAVLTVRLISCTRVGKGCTITAQAGPHDMLFLPLLLLQLTNSLSMEACSPVCKDIQLVACFATLVVLQTLSSMALSPSYLQLLLMQTTRGDSQHPFNH